jgi:plasmid stabilization system protein ParE
MARRIVWTKAALSDLKGLADRIGKDSPRYAWLVTQDIRRAVKNIRRFPFAMRIVPEIRSSSVREIIYGDYRIILAITKELLYIVKVIHSARDLLLHFNPWSN